MEKEQLEIIFVRLEELNEELLLANNTKDRRRRDKAVRDAKMDIANYAESIPIELMEVFNNQIGANSLNYQHAGDISQCIDIVKKLLCEDIIYD